MGGIVEKVRMILFMLFSTVVIILLCLGIVILAVPVLPGRFCGWVMSYGQERKYCRGL